MRCLVIRRLDHTVETKEGAQWGKDVFFCQTVRDWDTIQAFQCD